MSRTKTGPSATFTLPLRISPHAILLVLPVPDTELDNITSQYSRSNKRHSSGMISADRSLMFTSPITKRAKLGVNLFSHSPFIPLFDGCDGSMMERFAKEKKGGLKEDEE